MLIQTRFSSSNIALDCYIFITNLNEYLVNAIRSPLNINLSTILWQFILIWQGQFRFNVVPIGLLVSPYMYQMAQHIT